MSLLSLSPPRLVLWHTIYFHLNKAVIRWSWYFEINACSFWRQGWVEWNFVIHHQARIVVIDLQNINLIELLSLVGNCFEPTPNNLGWINWGGSSINFFPTARQLEGFFIFLFRWFGTFNFAKDRPILTQNKKNYVRPTLSHARYIFCIGLATFSLSQSPFLAKKTFILSSYINGKILSSLIK